MIGIVGYMSGGKSYFAVEHMLGMMLSGHKVVTNIQLCCQAVTRYLQIPCIFWKQLYFFLEEIPHGYHHLQISNYDAWPHGSPRGTSDYEKHMVYGYLDEVSSLFDSMTHASDSGIKKVATWARHTEKRGLRLFLIMQFASELHKRLRVHITEYVACTNTSTIKVPLLGCGLPWFMQGFSVRSRYASDGQTLLTRSKWVKIVPNIYSCYHTAQIVVGEQYVEPYIPVTLNYDLVKYRSARRIFIVSLVVYFLVTFSLFYFMVRYA